jgi:hypothetical protein
MSFKNHLSKFNFYYNLLIKMLLSWKFLYLQTFKTLFNET